MQNGELKGEEKDEEADLARQGEDKEGRAQVSRTHPAEVLLVS